MVVSARFEHVTNDLAVVDNAARKAKTTSAASRTGGAASPATTNSPETSLPPLPSSVHPTESSCRVQILITAKSCSCKAGGAIRYQVTPGTWVTASRYPPCFATNGSNRSSACRIVPSPGTGSSGYSSRLILSLNNGISASTRAQNIVPIGNSKNGGKGTFNSHSLGNVFCDVSVPVPIAKV